MPDASRPTARLLAALAAAALTACSGAVDDPLAQRGFTDDDRVADERAEVAPPTEDGAVDPLEPATPAPAARVLINEVAPAGEPTDWFEVLNAGDSAADLTGWRFTDDPGDATSGAYFADGLVLAPGERVVQPVDKDVVGFGLGGDEALGLFDAEGRLADAVDWAEGDSPDGASFARLPDGGAFATAAPTPGEPNPPE